MGHRPVIAFVLLGFLMAGTRARAADDPPTGEQIYTRLCANCHGATGQGTNETQNHPLIGDKSIGQLTKLIEKTMPEDNVGSCVGDDAASVAAFIHESFYSPTARARNEVARVELARLTVSQYRNAVADLIGHFRQPQGPGVRIGLRGQYTRVEEKERHRVIDRTDPVIDFDFGEGSPAAEAISPEEFSIQWQGSVFAPETGDYEFVVKTKNGMRLWVNDNRTPLIDADVRSGVDPEYRASRFLLGGRTYPLRLEMRKSKNAKEKTAAITLGWKIPGGIQEVIPQRYLSPVHGGETFVVATPFPPDDRSVGYERGTNVSKAWEQATTSAALEIASFVANRVDRLAGTSADAPDRAERIKAFCGRLAEQAFRRPLTHEETALYVTRQFEKPGDLLAAVKRVVVLVMKSAHFLYLDIEGRHDDGFAVASRLSFGLWDSLPDNQLMEAAKAGRLATRDDVRREAERMLADPRARAKLREFLIQWLHAEGSPEISKDSKKFPEFSREIAADLRTSLELALNEIALSQSADLRQLFLADLFFVNGRLAKFYGFELPEGAPFQVVRPPAGSRWPGLVSHPYLMAMLAYSGASSPIHRGVFLYRNVLGRSLRPPPVAVAPLAPELEPHLTTRERVSLQTSPETCQTCHGQINPLGFSLETYDAVGRFRATENDRAIDASGFYVDRVGARHEFASTTALVEYLAQSEEVHQAFTEQLFHHLVKQPVAAFGTGLPAWLQTRLIEQNFHIQKLLVDIMVSTALRSESQTRAPSVSDLRH